MPSPVRPDEPSRRKLKRTKRAALSVLTLGVLTFSLVAVEGNLTSRDAQQFTQTGEAVDVGETTMNIDCRGDGSPTVLFEAGLGESSLTWSGVAPIVARDMRVCTYDRSGYGWSEAREGRHDAGTQALQLKALLQAAEEPGPYVLVAHSYGSLIARQFAADESWAVAGMLLIEPTNDLTASMEDAALLPTLVTRVQAVVSRLGLARPFSEQVARDNAGAPLPALVASRAPFLYRAQALDTAAAELSESARSAQQAADSPLADDIPVVVLLDSAASHEDRRRFASLGATTRVHTMDGGHYLHYAHPAAIAAEIVTLATAERLASVGGPHPHPEP